MSTPQMPMPTTLTTTTTAAAVGDDDDDGDDDADTDNDANCSDCDGTTYDLRSVDAEIQKHPYLCNRIEWDLT